MTTTSEIPLEDWTIRDFDVKNVSYFSLAIQIYFDNLNQRTKHRATLLTDVKKISFRRLKMGRIISDSFHSTAQCLCFSNNFQTNINLVLSNLVMPYFWCC